MSSIIYNGHEIQDLIINGNHAELWLNGQKLYPSAHADPYNPLGLPPYTIRCRFSTAGHPTPAIPDVTWDSVTQVDPDGYIWDITKNSTDWNALLFYSSHLVEVLGANSSGVTNMTAMFGSTYLTSVPLFDTSSCTDMKSMFDNCRYLTSVPLFDTSSCTDTSSMFLNCKRLTAVPLFDISSCTVTVSMFDNCDCLTTVPLFDTSNVVNIALMFHSCTSLTTVPLFDTSSVTNMYGMFDGCYNVQSGALALYQQASTQASPPSNHGDAFQYCGRDTVTGAAELAQIPTDWGGTYDPSSMIPDDVEIDP